jgi:hypothetical protein
LRHCVFICFVYYSQAGQILLQLTQADRGGGQRQHKMKCGGNITQRQSNRGSNRDSWKNLTQPGLGRGGGADAVLPPDRVAGQQNKARPVPAQYVDAPVPFTALKHHWREETGIQEQQLAGLVASQQRKMTATPAVYEYENGGPSAVVKARQAIVTTLAAPAMPGAATQASPARVRFSPQATPPLHWTCMRSMAASPTLQPAPMPLVQQSVAVAQQHAWLRQQEALANFVPVDADLTMPPSSQQLLAVQQQQERAAAEVRNIFHKLDSCFLDCFICVVFCLHALGQSLMRKTLYH